MKATRKISLPQMKKNGSQSTHPQPTFKSAKTCSSPGWAECFDVFCGLPIYFELKKHGINAHLANFSFSDIENVDFGIRLTKTLVGVTPQARDFFRIFLSFICELVQRAAK